MMQDATPTPEYPRPSGSGSGTVIAVVAAVVVLGVLCCGGVLGLGWFSFRAVAVPAGAPGPVSMPASVPVTLANETEQTVLEMAAQQVPTDWTIPTAIDEGATEGTYVVTYAAPDKEIQLLGPRQVIVDPVNETVQFVPRD